MKHIYFFSLVLIFFSSCTIRFDRFPKDTLTEFPQEMQGKYLFTNWQDSDSTYVIITHHTIEFIGNAILGSGGISDTMKLSKGEKFYYLSKCDSLKNKLVWDIYPIKLSGNKLNMYALDADYYKKGIKKYFKPIEGFDNLYTFTETDLNKFCKKKLKSKNALKLVRIK